MRARAVQLAALSFLACTAVFKVASRALWGTDGTGGSLSTGRNLLTTDQDHAGVEVHECATNRWIELLERNYGLHVVEFGLMLYLFLAMAVLIDTHLVGALEGIAHSMKLPDNVIGATFLSVSNASPESCVSIVSATHGQLDTGLSTIIGACLFNLLVCTGVTILASPEQTITLDGSALRRDIVMYVIYLSIILYLFFSGSVGIGASVLVLIVYPTYQLSLLYYHVKLRGTSHGDAEESEPLVDKEEESDEYEGGIVGALAKPWKLLFGLVCRKSLKDKRYLTFFLCICWLMCISYCIVGLTQRLECGLEITADLIGLTVLSLGVATPDMLSNMMMTQQGHGNMAVSACFGANISGMALGLGTSWIIINVFYTYPNPVRLSSKGIKNAVFVLAGTFIFIIISMLVTKMKLTKYHAYIYLTWYTMFIFGVIMGAFDDAKIPILSYEDTLPN